MAMRMSGHGRKLNIPAQRIIDPGFPLPVSETTLHLQQMVKIYKRTNQFAILRPVFRSTGIREYTICVHVPHGVGVGKKYVRLTLPHLVPVEGFVLPVGAVEEGNSMLFAWCAKIIPVTGGDQTSHGMKTALREFGKTRGAKPEPMQVPEIGIPE